MNSLAIVQEAANNLLDEFDFIIREEGALLGGIGFCIVLPNVLGAGYRGQS